MTSNRIIGYRASSKAPALSADDLILIKESFAVSSAAVDQAILAGLIESVETWILHQDLNLARSKVPDTVDALISEFDRLSGDQRKYAFHLLWYAKEFRAGRTPRVIEG